MSSASQYNQKASQTTWDPDALLGRWPEASNAFGAVIATGSWRRFNRLVKGFQRQVGLKPDSRLGPATAQAIGVWMSDVNGLILGSVLVPTSCTVHRKLGLRVKPRTKPIRQVVLHVDVTFSSASTFRVLQIKNLSSHFGVDHDGSIHQWADPALAYTLHAGRANRRSIGVDLNSPVELKYQERDRKRRGRSRPIVTATIFGKERRNLGLFPEQVETLTFLTRLFLDEYGIPIRWPRHSDGRLITDPFRRAHRWHGWIGHHHLQRRHYCPAATALAVVNQIFE